MTSSLLPGRSFRSSAPFFAKRVASSAAMRARRPALMSAPAKLSPGLISTLRVAAGAVGGIASGGGGDSSTGPGASGQR